MVWSEHVKDRTRIKNTCPVDNYLTAVKVFEEENNVDLRSMFPKDEGHKMLGQALKQVDLGKSYKAQQKIYTLMDDTRRQQERMDKSIEKRNQAIIKKNEALLKKGKDIIPIKPKPLLTPHKIDNDRTNDLYGSPYNILGQHLKQGHTFEKEVFCSSNGCQNLSAKEYGEIYIAPPIGNEKVGDAIKRTVYETVEPCLKCQTGILSRSELKPKPVGKTTPWNLHLDLALVPFHANKSLKESVTDIPKEIILDGSLYRLGQVTCKATNKDHFTSLQYIPSRETFVHYDGMATKDPEVSRFRKVLPSDFDSKDILPIEVDYFLFKDKDNKPHSKK